MLFDVNIPAISKHLKNIYEQGEVTEERTFSKMEIVRMEGNRQAKRETVFYNLDAVICVGYRVNSIRATQFRQWATSVLREFAIRGYVLDKKRMENGSFLGEDYLTQRFVKDNSHLLTPNRCLSTEVKVLQYLHVGTAVTLGRYSSTEVAVLAMVPKGWILCIRRTLSCPLPHTSQVPVG